MSVERNLPIVRERKQAILKGDPDLVAQQKNAGKLLARERVMQLVDAASFVELDVLNADAGVVTGYGLIDGSPVYIYAQDFTVRGGSVGMAHAKKALKVMDLAEKTGAPLVAILDTAGARLEEGLDAMNAYALIAGRVSALSGVVPQIALVLGPCGGISSAIAGMSDFVVMSKNGSLFVNGPQVVSASAGKQLTLKDIGGAKASVKSGLAQLTAESDESAIALARKLITLLPQNNLDEAETLTDDDLNRELTGFNDIDKLSDARKLITAIADYGDVIELAPDFAASMITSIGRIGGTTVGFIANFSEKDDGRLTVYGCKKAARFALFCDCFSIPMITIVDSKGMKINDKPQGELARNAAQLMYALTEATSPKISLVTGNAIGMAYAAMASRAVSDVVYAWPGSVISALTPEIAVQLSSADELKGADNPYEKRAELEETYKNDIADAVNAAKDGYVDDVIEPAATRQMIAAALEMLSGKREEKPARKHSNMPL